MVCRCWYPNENWWTRFEIELVEDTGSRAQETGRRAQETGRRSLGAGHRVESGYLKKRSIRQGSGFEKAFGFLTVFGGPSSPSPSAVPWFPLVGVLIGALLGIIWYFASRVFGPVVGSIVVIAFDLLITGMLHFDGLGDCADGLLAHGLGDDFSQAQGHVQGQAKGQATDSNGLTVQVEQSKYEFERVRRLEIMTKPDIGAYGVIVIALTLLGRFGALVSLSLNLRSSILLLAGLWCVSRSLMSASLTVMPYAKAEGGLVSAFGARNKITKLGIRNQMSLLLSCLGVVLGAGLVIVWQWRTGGVAICLALIAGIGILYLAMRRIGGFTGDVLGAAGVILETVGLLAACAHWGAL